MYTIKIYYDNDRTMRQMPNEDRQKVSKRIGTWLQNIGKDFSEGKSLGETLSKYGKCELADGRVAGEIIEVNTVERFVEETRQLDTSKTLAERRAEVYSALRAVNNSNDFSFKNIPFGRIKDKFEGDIENRRQMLDLDNVKPEERLFAETLYDPANQNGFAEKMNYKAIDMLTKQIGFTRNSDNTINERIAINEALQNFRVVSHVFANSPDKNMYLEYMRQSMPNDIKANQHYKQIFGTVAQINAVVSNIDKQQKVKEENSYSSRPKDLLDAVKRGTLPAFNTREGMPDKDGNIVFKPDAVCLAGNGKRITGVNGLIIEKEAREKGFARNSHDGCIYVATESSIRDRSKLNPDEKIVVATVNNEANIKNNYYLYPETAMDDKENYLKTSGLRRYPDKTIYATDPAMEAAAYLGAWTAAAQLGAEFVTTPEVMKAMQQKTVEALGPLVDNGQSQAVYDFGKSVERQGDTFIRQKASDINQSINRTQSVDMSQSLGGIEM